jgi:hypothetical protein
MARSVEIGSFYYKAVSFSPFTFFLLAFSLDNMEHPRRESPTKRGGDRTHLFIGVSRQASADALKEEKP